MIELMINCDELYTLNNEVLKQWGENVRMTPLGKGRPLGGGDT